MSTEHHDDDHELVPEQTEGFKVGEKKTIDEYQQLGKFFFTHLNRLRAFVLPIIVGRHALPA